MKISVYAFLALLIPLAQAQGLAPDVLVKSITEEVVAILKKDKDIQSGDTKKVADLIDTKIVPHFDFIRMTRIAMGRNWRLASPDQQKNPRRGIQDPAGSYLFDRALQLSRSADRLQAPARQARGHRGDGEIRRETVGFIPAGCHRLRDGKDSRRVESLRRQGRWRESGDYLPRHFRERSSRSRRGRFDQILVEKNRQPERLESGQDVIKRDGDSLVLEGAVTLDTVPGLIGAVEEHLGQGARVVDFAT